MTKDLAQPLVEELLGWIDEYERWASSMPDAGLTADDPRSDWYMRRPQYPKFRACLVFPLNAAFQYRDAAKMEDWPK